VFCLPAFRVTFAGPSALSFAGSRSPLRPSSCHAAISAGVSHISVINVSYSPRGTDGSMSRSHGTQVIRSGRARDIPRARTTGQARDRCAAGIEGAAPETWPAQDVVRRPRAYAVPACRSAPTCSARTPSPRGYAPRRPAGYAFLTPHLPRLGYGMGVTPPVPTHVRSRGMREREYGVSPCRGYKVSPCRGHNSFAKSGGTGLRARLLSFREPFTGAGYLTFF
jgi:hypothetical protein